ncbi:hypothetical protein FQR65_LT20158 [Abscondita terminalis]|nr:hypothetical protein FQR65_LT20158 [Abscondita terminalis]
MSDNKMFKGVHATNQPPGKALAWSAPTQAAGRLNRRPGNDAPGASSKSVGKLQLFLRGWHGPVGTTTLWLSWLRGASIAVSELLLLLLFALVALRGPIAGRATLPRHERQQAPIRVKPVLAPRVDPHKPPDLRGAPAQGIELTQSPFLTVRSFPTPPPGPRPSGGAYAKPPTLIAMDDSRRSLLHVDHAVFTRD